jgi:ABC-type amino acid transport system permease subunit
MTSTAAASAGSGRQDLRRPVAWGVVLGVVQGALPFVLPWWDPSTVCALGLTLVAAVYVGFAVADGRRNVVTVEVGVASGFVAIAVAATTGSPWLVVAGLAAHGVKDLWQHRTQFVAGSRGWPPFCATVDAVAAGVVAVAIMSGAFPPW